MQDIIIYSDPQTRLAQASQIADQIARQNTLEDYLEKQTRETKRRQKSDIALFERYLQTADIQVTGLSENLALWQHMSFGLVEGFKRWQLQKGYAIGSVNTRLATIKAYCELAVIAGYLSSEVNSLIKTIKGYSRKEGRNVDEGREKTRKGYKKQETVVLSFAHVQLLKNRLRQDETILASRDYLLFCLLVDHGLRCGEIAELEARHLDIQTGLMMFYRRKVDKVQTHRLTADTLEAAIRYFQQVSPSHKLFDGYTPEGLTTRAICARVRYLGEVVEVKRLSPHDLRHYWATEAIRHGTDVASLQQAGGWNSPVMPLKYVEDSRIANEGVKLSS